MEENFNYAFMVGLASILWIKVAYDAGKRKGNLEGRKAVRKYYEKEFTRLEKLDGFYKEQLSRENR